MKSYFDRLSAWLAAHIASPKRTHCALVLALSVAIFLIAVGVRVLHWQDSHDWVAAGTTSLTGVYERYYKEAERMVEERSFLFPREPPAEGDARMLAHPPGYSILLAVILKFSNDPRPALWAIQTTGDALAAVLVFLIAAEVLPLAAAAIGGLLVALSPHLAFYTLFLSPDSLTVLPILVAIYLIVRAVKRPGLPLMFCAGAMVGVSCWLAANGLGLAVVLAALTLLFFAGRQRWHYSIALLLGTFIIIAPITARNLLVFHRFIPISIQTGLAMAEGIGDYDRDGQLDMPRSDHEARAKDVEWSGRADYGGSLWQPDGIARDRVRLEHATAVIRAHPGWFLGVMLRRAGFMLCYNDSQAHEFPFNTAMVPVVAAERGFAHAVSPTNERQPLWQGLPLVVSLNNALILQSQAVSDQAQPVRSLSPPELLAEGTALSAQASAALADEGQAVEVSGDASAYGEQFVFAPIAVERNTDYVIALPASLASGDIAIKVTSADRRTTLASTSLAGVQMAVAGTRHAERPPATTPELTVALQLPFATGNRSQVCLVLSNNAGASTSPVARIGAVTLYQVGVTPATWTHWPRLALRGIQRNLFTTAHLLPLIVIGLVGLLLAGRWRVALIGLAVPFYYLGAQSLFHTEYRYILAMHYFLFVLAGVALYCAGLGVRQAALWLIARSKRQPEEPLSEETKVSTRPS